MDFLTTPNDDKFISVNAKLSNKYGLNEAMILQFFAYFVFLNAFNKANYLNNQYWVRISVQRMLDRYITALTYGKIRYALDRLVKKKILKRENLNKYNYLSDYCYESAKTYFYTFKNMEIFEEVLTAIKSSLESTEKYQDYNIDNLYASLFKDGSPEKPLPTKKNKTPQYTIETIDESNIHEQLQERGVWSGQISKIMKMLQSDKIDFEYIQDKVQQHDFIKRNFPHRMKAKGKTAPGMYLANIIIEGWIDEDYEKHKGKLKDKEYETKLLKTQQELRKNHEDYITVECFRLYETLTPEERESITIEAENKYNSIRKSIPYLSETPESSLNSEEQKADALKGYIVEELKERFLQQLLPFDEFCRQNE